MMDVKHYIPEIPEFTFRISFWLPWKFQQYNTRMKHHIQNEHHFNSGIHNNNNKKNVFYSHSKSRSEVFLNKDVNL